MEDDDEEAEEVEDDDEEVEEEPIIQPPPTKKSRGVKQTKPVRSLSIMYVLCGVIIHCMFFIKFRYYIRFEAHKY